MKEKPRTNKQKNANEILDILESNLVSYVKDVFKSTANYEITDQGAKVVLAKLGERYLIKLKVLSE